MRKDRDKREKQREGKTERRKREGIMKQVRKDRDKREKQRKGKQKEGTKKG